MNDEVKNTESTEPYEYGKDRKLMQDIVIPAGTIFSAASQETKRYGKGHVSTFVGLTRDTSGEFVLCTEDEPNNFSEYFGDPEDVVDLAQSFGWALEQLKLGKKVARSGWNGKGMFIFLLPAGIIPKSALHDPALIKVLENTGKDTFDALGSIRMKTADDKILTGWLASQTDMLSDDWELVE